MITVSIKDTATPALMRLLAQARSAGPMQAAGQRVAVLLRNHFRDANTSRANRKGWPRQNFWAGFARRVSLGPTSPGKAVIHIQDPQGALQHKISGGVVRAKRGRMLAIPLTGEAYKRGAQARIPDAFPDAFVVRTAKGAWIVQDKYSTRGNGRRRSGIKGQRLQFLFKLVPKVTHAADPKALPDAKTMAGEAVIGINNWFQRRLPRA